MPKSPIFTNLFEVKKMLADFKSRCSTFLLCKAWIPITSITNQARIIFYSRRSPFFLETLMNVARSPPIFRDSLHSQYSITMIRLKSKQKHSMYLTMKGYWLMSLNFLSIYICIALVVPTPWPRWFPPRPYYLGSSSWLRSTCHSGSISLSMRCLSYGRGTIVAPAQ